MSDSVQGPPGDAPAAAASGDAHEAAHSHHGHHEGGVLKLAVGAIGVVFGDIGTSPLYALKECFSPGSPHHIPVTGPHVLGVLSLIFWSLVLIVSVKYLLFILRADHQGEGGVLALLTLAVSGLSPGKRETAWLMALGLLGASLLYGDGMITPAISVLSAVEGLTEVAGGLQPFVVPVTVLVLVALFSVQWLGTARVGALFGPIMLVWFAVLAAMGAQSVWQAPGVLRALNPWHGVAFFWHAGWPGFVVLGAVFLVVTGGEALYADMGHFGRRPIRLAWYTVVMPALLLFQSIVARENFGNTSLSSSNRLGQRSEAIRDIPVTLPPGRARLATIPVATGSLVLSITIGIVCVACLSSKMARVPDVNSASTFSWTSSFASSGKRFWSPSAYRISKIMFFPST
jgi:hypothetical protein